jgi:omega-amidase
MTPKPSLRVTLVQTAVFWEAKAENLAHLETLLNEVVDTDLIVLPEMFSTGFSMRPEALAETMEGEAVRWMQSMARNKRSTIVGSLIIEEQGSYYNRLVWMRPDASFAYYDKRHLFSFAQEDAHYAAGKQRLIVDLHGWKVCPLVCYDLRFPVWTRNQAFDGSETESVFDLQLFVANWPEARRIPWNTLLEARAHENQCFVIGVNRVGEDGNGISHAGDSVVFSPKGEKLTSIQAFKEDVYTLDLHYDDLASFRSKFTAWKDKDRFTLH